MWEKIKSWFKSNYVLIKTIPGTQKFGPNLSYERPTLYKVYYNEKNGEYKVYCIDFDGDVQELHDTSCFLHEARKNGYELS